MSRLDVRLQNLEKQRRARLQAELADLLDKVLPYLTADQLETIIAGDVSGLQHLPDWPRIAHLDRCIGTIGVTA